MNHLTTDEYYRNPALRDALIARAHKQRNEAIRAGFAWLRAKLGPRKSATPGLGHRLARFG